MKLDIKKYSIEQYLMFMLIICTFGIIGSKTIDFNGCKVLVEIAAIGGMIFSFYMLIMAIYKRKDYISFLKENKFLSIILFLFVFSIIMNGYSTNKNHLMYSINKTVPFIIFFFILVYLKNESKEMLSKYLTFSAYIFIISFILAITFYLFGYTNGAFSLTKGIELVSKKECMDLFSEVRLYWLLSHKSRFTIYCIIGFLFIIKSNISNQRIKKFGVILTVIAVLLSNSMTGIGIYFLVFIPVVLIKLGIVNKILNSKNKKIIIIVIVCSLVLSAIGTLVFIGGKRDLKTLGSRTFIWEAAINTIEKKPNGIIHMSNKPWLKAKHEGQTLLFTNGHNIYLNEMIENGFFIGVIYVVFSATMVIKALKSKKFLLAWVLFLTLFGFGMIESINSREMNYILFLFFGIIYYSEDSDKKVIFTRR